MYKYPEVSRVNLYRGASFTGNFKRQKEAYSCNLIEKKKPRVLVGFRIPPKQKQLLRELASKKRVSVSSYLCLIWEKHLRTIGKLDDKEISEDDES